jgi:hypothetical protein
LRQCREAAASSREQVIELNAAAAIAAAIR